MPLLDQAKLVVRDATLAEIPAIAALLQQAFLEYEALYTPAAFAATTPTADQIQQRWHEGPVWMALQADRLVGTVAVVPQTSAVYLRSMAVHPRGRGQGIGKALLNYVEKYASAHSIKRMYLSTTPFLAAAIRLYERCEFTRANDGPSELYGTPIFTMEKLL
jgi:N-acetylglutamate synthase-like GNAT family acetyltransferase